MYWHEFYFLVEKICSQTCTLRVFCYQRFKLRFLYSPLAHRLFTSPSIHSEKFVFITQSSRESGLILLRHKVNDCSCFKVLRNGTSWLDGESSFISHVAFSLYTFQISMSKEALSFHLLYNIRMIAQYGIDPINIHNSLNWNIVLEFSRSEFLKVKLMEALHHW